MAHLSLSLLGPFQVTLDGEPVTDFKSTKVRALLAYLAAEADRPHPREMLAGLLWPEWPDRDALSNLRYALSNLRGVIGDRARARVPEAGPPFLLVTRESLQFNTASDHSLDVAAFLDLTGRGGLASDRDRSTLEGLEKGVALYRGSFLEGFSVADSAPFEEWALFTRERLARQMSSALHRLAAAYEQREQYKQAQSYAWRQVELEPWDEEAHQQLMRALALGGQRAAALAQYENCRRLLAEELGVEPGRETTRLYGQIRDGQLEAPRPIPAPPPDLGAEPPPFLDEETGEPERPVFVAREGQLARLGGFLERALAGQGRVAFVTGEAGSGKTALLQEFTRRAQETDASPVAASGNCNAYTGIGDPYLPFREILELLTGDVEALWAAGAMTGEHARRLWHTLPLAAQALVEAGPDLIGTFVPRSALLERAGTCTQWSGRADWLARLDGLLEPQPATALSLRSPKQSDLFEQYARVLKALARQAPLVLVVDDLQWADLGSISLLFHLGRQLAGCRILIVGVYRPVEVALGRDGARHPLEPVVNELQRVFGDITIDLGQAESQDFVEAYLDSQPNRLGSAFRGMLYRQTRGHPLFTIELLRGLQEQGALVQDRDGSWVEGPALDWETLPARVEAVIAERIGRLSEPLQAALRVASVEGETFTAEVVACVGADDEGELVGRLSRELDRRHRLVRAQGILRVNGRRLSRYRFRHILFQRYLYRSLDDVERAHLHEAVGNTLEALVGSQAEAMAVMAGELAWHFQEAGLAAKAIDYSQQAGDRAMRLSAGAEAITHYSQGLALLKTLPDTGDREHRLQRAQRELVLLTSLTVPLSHTKSMAAPEVDSLLARAWELCRHTGEAPQLFWVLIWLSVRRGLRGELQAARETMEQVFGLAELAEEPVLLAYAHHMMGWLQVSLGEFSLALDHAEFVMDHHDALRGAAAAILYGIDAGVQSLSYAARALWQLGYPEQALQRSRDALARAQELDHPYSLADALSTGGAMVHLLRRDLQAAQALAEEALSLAAEHDFRPFLAQSTAVYGRVLVGQGRIEEGIAQLHRGLAAWEATGSCLRRPTFAAWLAEAYGKAGQAEEGLSVLAEALSRAEETGEREIEAELRRLKGDLLLEQGDQPGAEACFEHAIEVARRQRAKSLELRATTSLARLWQRQGKREEAWKALTAIYGWFTEGFDTADLKDAKALLEQLSHQ